MLIPKSHRKTVYEYLFKEGVMVANVRTDGAKHRDTGIPNLHVINLMSSLKSRGFVREGFAWRHYYWFLTNDGIQFLREYLHLPAEIIPTTLRRGTAREGLKPRARGFEDGAPRATGTDREYRRAGTSFGGDKTADAGAGAADSFQFRGGFGRGRNKVAASDDWPKRGFGGPSSEDHPKGGFGAHSSENRPKGRFGASFSDRSKDGFGARSDRPKDELGAPSDHQGGGGFGSPSSEYRSRGGFGTLSSDYHRGGGFRGPSDHHRFGAPSESSRGFGSPSPDGRGGFGAVSGDDSARGGYSAPSQVFEEEELWA